MNRDIWKKTISDESIPQWPCPSCGSGVLFLQKNSFKKAETLKSRRAKEEEDWEPDKMEYYFTCIAACSTSWCNDIFVIAGTGSVETFYYPVEEKDVYMDTFQAKFIFPALHLFNISSSYPKALSTELKSSFALYWSDIRACANRTRSCIEILLTKLGIKRFSLTKGARRKLNLHQRIELFRKKYPDLGDALLAVKWIGNEGSHIGNLTHDDLLDAFEILEHVLEEIYLKRKQYLAKLAKTINKNKGPVKRK